MKMQIESRIVGALLGLACGDALGAPAEFMSQADLRAHWGRLTEMTGGGVWAPGEWTDDTGMALCIAEGEKLSGPDVSTADFAYCRLRKVEYTSAEREKIRARVLVHPGDVFVYYKHEDDPAGTMYAEELLGAPSGGT